MSDGSVETTCGKSFDSQPAAAGHTSSCGCEIVTDGGEETDGSDGGLRAEIATVMPGKDPLSNLAVVRTGLTEYSVLSARNGGVTRHHVTLDPAECTCDDWAFNLEDGEREVCAHYVAAFLEGSDITTSDIGVSEIASLTRESRQLAQDAQAALQGASEANVAARETEAAAVQEASDAEVADAEPDGQQAAEAAERLSAAYDDTDGLTDMEVQHSAGVVWVQTGKDTPETLETGVGPDLDVHEWLMQEPDQVMWVHDGSQDWADSPHRLYDDKPGQYWTNAIEPEDVEEYISEVLA